MASSGVIYHVDEEIAHVDNEIPTGEAEKRIALVNLDWDNMRAVDILALMVSFTSPAAIKKVITFI